MGEGAFPPAAAPGCGSNHNGGERQWVGFTGALQLLLVHWHLSAVCGS